MTHDASVQSHRFHWNLSLGTPLFKGHLHSGDKNVPSPPPLFKGHLHSGDKNVPSPPSGGGEGTLKVSLGRRVPPKLSKSPNPVEYKTAVDRFVLLWQLTEMHWWKQLSEDLTTEKVATVLIFFSSPREWPLRLQRDDFTLWQGWKHDRRDLRYWQND